MTFLKHLSIIAAAIPLHFVTAAPSTTTINGIPYNTSTTISRDIAVIGGGSSGTFAAIRLFDSGKSIAIIEKQDRMGGHTNTYLDPVTGQTIDYGVAEFHNNSLVLNYTSRLNLTMGPVSSPTNTPVYVDFRTGVQNFTFSSANFTAGMTIYSDQLAKYPYLDDGFFLPDPVPEDLLLSFGDFAEKYALGPDFMYFIGLFAQGLGDLLAHPTLYVFKNFGLEIIAGITNGFLAPTAGDNSLIYENAAKILGDENIFLNSNIIAVERNDVSVKILFKTPEGMQLLEAEQLVFTIPPKMINLVGWDLSIEETSLFSQFNNSGYYSAIVSNTGIPPSTSVNNVNSDSEYGLAVLPGLYTIIPSVDPQLMNIYYGSATALSDEEVQADMLAQINRLQITNKTASNPDIVAYARHTPFECWVGADAIEKGFYTDLYALQGKRNTWYTGAAFHTHDSSMLWDFTEALIPNITAV